VELLDNKIGVTEDEMSEGGVVRVAEKIFFHKKYFKNIMKILRIIRNLQMARNAELMFFYKKINSCIYTLEQVARWRFKLEVLRRQADPHYSHQIQIQFK